MTYQHHADNRGAIRSLPLKDSAMPSQHMPDTALPVRELLRRG